MINGMSAKTIDVEIASAALKASTRKSIEISWTTGSASATDAGMSPIIETRSQQTEQRARDRQNESFGKQELQQPAAARTKSDRRRSLANATPRD